MELWVRSQCGELLEKAEMIKVGTTDSGKTYSIIVNNDYVYADYKTKERALEVLDEIQKLLMPVITYTQKEPIKSDLEQGIYQIKQDVDLKIQQLSTYVYQMPKE